jgi:hypothetical protein
MVKAAKFKRGAKGNKFPEYSSINRGMRRVLDAELPLARRRLAGGEGEQYQTKSAASNLYCKR